MNIFYKIKEDLVAELLSYNLLNSMTYGDIDDVDLDKTSAYALGPVSYTHLTLPTNREV